MIFRFFREPVQVYLINRPVAEVQSGSFGGFVFLPKSTEDALEFLFLLPRKPFPRNSLLRTSGACGTEIQIFLVASTNHGLRVPVYESEEPWKIVAIGFDLLAHVAEQRRHGECGFLALGPCHIVDICLVSSVRIGIVRTRTLDKPSILDATIDLAQPFARQRAERVDVPP